MSKRNRHRGGIINVNELAEALTQRGWQPPRQIPPMLPMQGPVNNMETQGNHGPHPVGNDPLSGNLRALSGLLGAANGGIPPMYPNPQQHNNRNCGQPTDKDLLKALFQQVLNELRRH